MRVLYFTRDYSPHDHRFVSTLADGGYEVYYLRLERQSRSLEDRSLPSAVRQVLWRGGRIPARWLDYPALALDLRRVYREVQPDIIHAGPVQRVASLAVFSGLRPLVTMSWGSDILLEADESAWMRLLARYTLRRTTAMVGDCLAVKERAEAFGLPKNRFTLFPWGVDLQHFSPGEDGGLRRRLGWEREFVLLSLRSWEPLYGVEHIARAFVRAAQKEPRLRLILLGGGSQGHLLRRIFEDGGVMERVIFGGQVSNLDLVQYYRAADLYLSASHSDGSSVSLMEALACGLPVLVSDIPGNREWVEQSDAGWLFPDRDEPALENGILRAGSNNLKEMGAAARRLAEERANWPENFKKLEQAYRRAIQLQGERNV